MGKREVSFSPGTKSPSSSSHFFFEKGVKPL